MERNEYIVVYKGMYGHNPPAKLLEKYYPTRLEPCYMLLFEICKPCELCPKSCPKNGG